MKNIVIFIGAFNPPTTAHIAVAKAAADKYGCKVVFVPSHTEFIQNVERKDAAYTAEERVNMLNILAKTRNWMDVSDYDLQQKEQPKAIQTLHYFAQEQNCQPKLLIGSDNLKLFAHWHRAEDILKTFGIIVAARRTDDCDKIIAKRELLQKYKDKIDIIFTPEAYHIISSSAFRKDKLRNITFIPEEIRYIV